MCTGPAFVLVFPFINARCQSAAVSDIRLKHISCLSKRCGGEKAMKGKEACIPGGMSLVASHFSVAVFFLFFFLFAAFPCRRSRLSQDLTRPPAQRLRSCQLLSATVTFL